MATINICMPLVKFSDAVGQSGNTVPWSHFSAPDLSVIVKGDRSAQGALSMRVVHGTITMESINVAQKIDQATRDQIHAERTGHPMHIERLPIYGISKESLLALRYNLYNGEARRVQLRFEDSTQCRQVVDVFVRRGMQFQEQRPGTARPGAGTTRFGSAFSERRPATAQTTSPYYQQSCIGSSSSSLPAWETKDPSPQASTHTSNLHRRASSQIRSHPGEIQKTLPPTRFLPDDPLVPLPHQPSITNPQECQHNHTKTSLGPNSSSSLRLEALTAVRHTGERNGSPSNNALKESGLQNVIQPLQPQQWPIEAAGCRASAPLSSVPLKLPPQLPPSTTLIAPGLSDTLEHEIPPRRELPFKRPGSRLSESAGGESRPEGSSLLLRPSSKPMVTRDSAAQSVQPEKAIPQSRNLETTGGYDEAGVSEEFGGTPNYAVRANEGTQRHILPDGERSLPSSDSIPMHELVTGRKAHLNRHIPVRAPRLYSLTDAPHEVESPREAETSLTSDTFRSDPRSRAAAPVQPRIDRAYTAVKLAAQSGQDDDLNKYGAQSPEDRQAALEQFMVDHLEDPAFATLCGDVENCWRRIALGL